MPYMNRLTYLQRQRNWHMSSLFEMVQEKAQTQNRKEEIRLRKSLQSLQAASPMPYMNRLTYLQRKKNWHMSSLFVMVYEKAQTRNVNEDNLYRAYKLPLSCPAHLPLLTACHCLAKVPDHLSSENDNDG